MARTITEQRIIRSRKSTGLLVPKLEAMFKWPVRLDKDDADFIHWLISRNALREARRGKDRTFSPSSLGQCLRQVFLNRNFESFDIERVFLPRVEASGYFFDSEFEHIKWQAMIRKLAAKDDDIELVGGDEAYPGFEINVVSKHGDHQGTIDVLMLHCGVPVLVDVKGLNVRGFQLALKGEADPKYLVQTADYMMLLNSNRPKIINKRVEKAILLVKAKAGGDRNNPLGLTEIHVDLKKHLPVVKERLEALRGHEKEGTIPKPECTSRTSIQFQSCAFQKYCRDEIKEIEAKRAKDRDASRLAVSTPTRSDSSKRPRSRGRKRSS